MVNSCASSQLCFRKRKAFWLGTAAFLLIVTGSLHDWSSRFHMFSRLDNSGVNWRRFCLNLYFSKYLKLIRCCNNHYGYKLFYTYLFASASSIVLEIFKCLIYFIIFLQGQWLWCVLQIASDNGFPAGFVV